MVSEKRKDRERNKYDSIDNRPRYLVPALGGIYAAIMIRGGGALSVDRSLKREI